MNDKINMSELSKSEQTEVRDRDITEAYFVARGWKLVLGEWVIPNLGGLRNDLPNILDSFPDFKREVLEVMGEDGFDVEIIGKRVQLCRYITSKDAEQRTVRITQGDGEPIKSNEILKAAVLAATRYWEGKK